MTRTSRRLFSLCLLVCALTVALGTASASAAFLSPTPDPLVGSSFQGGDGNQLNEAGHADWQSQSQIPAGSNGFVNASPDSLVHDSCFGSPNQKQLKPGGWVYIDCGTGVNPSKTNLLAGWSSVDHAGDVFLYLAFTREAQTGNTYLAFELNQRTDAFHNPAGYDVPCRTDGDLLISYEVQSGGSPPNVDIVVHEWHTATKDATTGCALTGSVSELDPQPYAQGAVNNDSIANYLSATPTFAKGTFGEAALNLSGFFRNQVGAAPCFAFGSISMESHSSTSFTSDLKDFIGPAPLDVANCKINVDKQVRVRDAGVSDPTTDSYADTASAVVGSTFDYKFDVSVPAGSPALALTSISDVLGTKVGDPAFCAPDPYLGGNAPHNYGDGNDNNAIDPGEHWLFTCSRPSTGSDVANSPLHNTVFVEGKIPGCTGSVAACGSSDSDDASATVTKATPNIDTVAQTPVTIGQTIHDTATVSGGYDPSGDVEFELYAPTDSSCDGPAVYTDTETLTSNGDGTYSATSGDFTTTAVGDYHWIATYSGNGTDKSVAGNCGDDGETSHVDKAKPQISTTASATTELGHAIHDSAQLSGGYSPTGSVSFTVYGPNDAGCTGAGTAIGSGQLDANGNAVSPDFTPTAAGTYRFVASYAGDDNNEGADGKCNDANEAVDVTQPQLAIDKTGPAHAYDGDVITFDITVTNPGTSPVHDVKLTDQIQGSASTCDSLTGPTGDTNGDSVLQTSETWKYVCTYTVKHADEDATHHIVNVATVEGKNSFGDQVGPVSDDHTVLIVHPAIAIDKTGPARATQGDKVGYALTVTNPGDEPFAEATVKVTDAQCNGDAVTLIGKGGDASPATLDPGDTWTYSCSVQTAVGQTSVHNEASVAGCDQFGKCVNASDSADTILDAQLLEPVRVPSANARLLAPTGCAAKAFNARVRGTNMATITFVLDGKVIKKVRNTKNAKLVQARINPAKLKLGVHRIVVNVTFRADTKKKPTTMRVSFQRCSKKLITPRFTG